MRLTAPISGIRTNASVKSFLIASTLTILHLSIVSCSVKSEPDTDWSALRLNGTVQSVREISYKALDRFGAVSKGVRERKDYLEDIPYTTSDYDKFIIFNPDGRIIENNTYYSTGRLNTKIIYKYDNNGKYAEVNIYNSDGELKRKESFTYDKDLNNTRVTSYNADGGIARYYTLDYDTKKRLVSRIYYDKDSNPGTKIQLEYKNGTGHDSPSEVIEYNEDGSPYMKYTYSYNKAGKCIEEKWYDYDELRGYMDTRRGVNYTYDANNDLIQSDKKGSFSDSKIDYIYDSNGNIVEETEIIHKTLAEMPYPTWTSTYELDDKGNWIRQLILKNQIPRYIVEREIEYFK